MASRDVDGIDKETLLGITKEDPSRLAIGCGYYIGWIIIGFYTGFHWLVLAFFVTKYCNRLRYECIIQAIIYWLFAILFWIFRQSMLPWYINCKNGVSMSRNCLFNEQPTKYAAFYVIHIYLMVWVFVGWFFDLVFLYIFLKKINNDLSSSTKLLLIRFIIITIITTSIVIIWSQINWSIN